MNRARVLVLAYLGFWVVLLAALPVLTLGRRLLQGQGNLWRLDAHLPGDAVFVSIDPAGLIWVGGTMRKGETWEQRTGYLAVFTPEGELSREYTQAEIGIHPIVRDIFFDSHGRTWIAAEKTVAVLDGSTWKVLPSPHPDPDCLLDSIAVDLQDRVWVGSLDCTLAVYQDETWNVNPENSPVQQVSTLALDPEGRLWVGKRRGGLFRLDTQNGEWKGYDAGFEVNGIAFHPDGRVWISGAGLASFDPNTAEPDRTWKTEYVSTQGVRTHTVAVDAAGRVYTDNGASHAASIRIGADWQDTDRIQIGFGQVVSISFINHIAIGLDDRAWYVGKVTGEDFGPALFSANLSSLTDGAPASPLAVYIPPWYAWISLALVLGLWVAALRTHPAAPPEETPAGAPVAFQRAWMLANGAAWMAAFGILLTALNLATIAGLLEANLSILVVFNLPWWSILLAGAVLGSLVAAAQWIALNTHHRRAGAWAWNTLWATTAGSAPIAAYILLVQQLENLSENWSEDANLIFGYCLLIPLVMILPLLILAGSFWLAGDLAGRRQAGLLSEDANGGDAVWRKANRKAMAISSIFGPFGGIMFAQLTAGQLTNRLFGSALQETVIDAASPDKQSAQ